jgi:potassium/hydrogen antiporter
VPRDRLARLDSLFRESPDVARRLGLLFGEMTIRGEAKLAEVAAFYDLDFGEVAPGATMADWMADRLGERLQAEATVSVPRARLVVRRLDGARVSSVGLQLREILQIDPEDQLLDRFVEETDETTRLRRWVRRLRPRWRRSEPLASRRAPP